MAVSQVRGISRPDEESPEAGTSRSRPRRYKATNMSLEEMVDILWRKDYDGNHGPYHTPNRRKAQIMDKVARNRYNKFGVRRSKEQLRKRWSDLKLREPEQYRKIKKIIDKSTYCSCVCCNYLYYIFACACLAWLYFRTWQVSG